MAENIIKAKQKQRYDTEANWKSNDPILLAGEMAISSDKNGRYKVGDGKSKWSALSYAKADLTKSDVTTALGYTPPTTNTTYSTGTASTAGIGKLYTATGNATDGSMTQASITAALNDKSGTGHTHNSIQDSNDGKTATLAYSKSGLGYSDYTWLAAWNGYELRAVNKDQFATAGHTHNYAGSSSAGGSANSAVKLDTATAGSVTQPIYFSGGKPTACTYTLGKSVPSNAVFTDTWRGIQNNLTSDSTTDSLSAAQGKALKTLITDLSGKSFQKQSATIINTTDWDTIKDPGCYKVQVGTWGDSSKLHSPNAYLSSLYQYGLLLVFRAADADTELRTVQIFMPHNSSANNPILTRMFNGSAWNAWCTVGRGTSWSEILNKPSTFTPSSHNHDDRYYTESEIDAKLKTKSDTGHTHDLSTMINTLSTGTSVPTDADYFVSQYVGGGTTTTSYHRRPVSALWSYIKTKTDGLYQAKGSYATSSHKHGNADITDIDASKIKSGTIDIARLPQGALERCVVVADETARLKLTTATVQKGDTVKVTATNKMYFVVDDTKLTSEEGYEVYTAGTATSVPWSGVTGKPSTYPPSSHTHSYLPLAGGTLNGEAFVSWADSGNWAKNNSGVTFPVKRGGLKWAGQSDGIELFAEETANDNLELILKFTDDNSNGLTIRNASGTAVSRLTSTGLFTGKASTAGTADVANSVAWGNITGKPSSMPASDVYAWAKAATKPAYTKSEVGLGNVDNTADKDKTVKSAGTWTTARTLSLTGSVTGSASIDGSNNVTISTTTNHSHAYSSLTGLPSLGDASSKTVRTLTSPGSSGWKDASTDDKYVPTMSFMAYWNGAYSGSSSNLAYCNKGAFGTIVTKNVGDYAVAGHTHSYLPLSGGTVTGVTAFTNTTASTSKSTGAVKVSGGVGVAGRMSANEVMVGDGVTLKYDSSNKCINFVFS